MHPPPRDPEQCVRISLVRWAMISVIAGFGVVAILIRLSHAELCAKIVQRQTLRIIQTPARRGRILDRQGLVLTDTRLCYDICVAPEVLRHPRETVDRTGQRIEYTVARLGAVLGNRWLYSALPPERVARHLRRRSVLPVPLWQDVDKATLAKWAVNWAKFPATSVGTRGARRHHCPERAAHVRGYTSIERSTTGTANPEKPRAYQAAVITGKEGLERQYDRLLAGKQGERIVRVDAVGFTYSTVRETSPRAGGDLHLALEFRTQCYSEEALAGVRGAVVVLVPQTGEVLAMASSPSYGLHMTPEEWQRLAKEPGQPFLNRAIAGLYLPGSVFKPLVAIAALESGAVTEATELSCNGTVDVGRAFHCWRDGGHGPLPLEGALAVSCNCYFYQAALRTQPEAILQLAREIGFGEATMIDLPGENAGVLPDDPPKAGALPPRLYPGDVCNLGIGQGRLTVTPLQMAVFCAAIANGGDIFVPRMVRARHAVVPHRRLGWSDAMLGPVRRGMRAAVHSDRGTARLVRLPGVTMAAKTGTAQAGPGRQHAWMILYAPYDAPRYAIAMVIENADGGGGQVVAPRLKRLMQRIFNTEEST